LRLSRRSLRRWPAGRPRTIGASRAPTARKPRRFCCSAPASFPL